MSASRGMWQSAVILLLLIEPSEARAQKRQIPAPQRDFMIFFDWNSAVISARNKGRDRPSGAECQEPHGLAGKGRSPRLRGTSMSEQKSGTLSEAMAKAAANSRDGIDAERVEFSGQG